MTEERFELPAQLSIMLPDASKVKMSGDRSVATAPMSPPNHLSIARAENAELERRLLALERVLQALVAHMAEAEPKFLARLTETFCVPLRMTRFEHDYTDTESYAAEFVRSVVRLGERAATKPPETEGWTAARHPPARAQHCLCWRCHTFRSAKRAVYGTSPRTADFLATS